MLFYIDHILQTETLNASSYGELKCYYLETEVLNIWEAVDITPVQEPRVRGMSWAGGWQSIGGVEGLSLARAAMCTTKLTGPSSPANACRGGDLLANRRDTISPSTRATSGVQPFRDLASAFALATPPSFLSHSLSRRRQSGQRRRSATAIVLFPLSQRGLTGCQVRDDKGQERAPITQGDSISLSITPYDTALTTSSTT